MSAGRSLSIVEYFAEHSGYKCGYCGNEDTNYSHGMWAHTLTTKDYQVRQKPFSRFPAYQLLFPELYEIYCM